MIVAAPGQLAFKLIDILSKEDHQVCFVSFEDFPKESRPKNPYLHFTNNSSYSIMEKKVQAVGPEAVLFLRDDFESEDYGNNFIAFLDLSVACKARFIYLSNLDTIRREGKTVDESAEVLPVTSRGEAAAQCEYRIQMKHQSYGLNYLILRTDDLYGSGKGEDNALVRMERELSQGSKLRLARNELVYPLHCDDFAYAVKLGLESSRDDEIYHVLGGQGLLRSRFYRQMAEKLGLAVSISAGEQATTEVLGEKILNQMEWVRFHDLDQDLAALQLPSPEEREKERRQKERKKPRWRRDLRQTLEVSGMFVLFILLDQMVQRVFGQINIDCMVLFIVAIALRYQAGWVYTATSGAVLYHFLKQGSEAFHQFGFFAFADDIANAVFYLIIGLMITFAVESLRAKNAEAEDEERELELEKRELMDINGKMLMVKNEYEKRLLGTKYSFASLQSVLNRISVLHPEKIMVELMNIIADMLETQTVSIYTLNHQFARLMVSLNDESIYCGKSWNVPDTNAAMYDCLCRGEIYRGNAFQGEPALVAPILRDQKLMALVVIQNMKFENLSTYYINLLKTLVVISGDMVHRANEYYGEVRNKNYLDGTGIANYDWFRQVVQFEKEKSSQGFSTYCIARCGKDENASEAYEKLKSLFRSTDPFGVDREGRLCILFKNVAEKDRAIVAEKINRKGIQVELLDDID